VSPCEATRTAYVLKMYPRFSETFIVNEILAHEAAGAELEIFSLRPPADGRFHEALAEVRAPVTYLASHHRRTAELWELLRGASAELPVAQHLDELLAAEVGDTAQAVELAQAIRTRGIGHLHAHFASVATTVTRLASLLSGVPYTFTAHAKDIFHVDVDADDLRRKLEGCAAAVTVSDFNLAHLAWSFGPAAQRTERIYNGVDLTRFPYSPDLDQRPPVIVAVGRLVEKKGFADLVAACGRLVAGGRRFRCQIIGAGPEEEPLRRQVDSLGLAATVDLLGPLPQGRVRSAVAGAAALAVPCVVGTDGNRDGLPTVLLEGMALGTPCVATPVTGIPEVIRHEETGLLVAEHDPEALAGALARLLDDHRLGARLAATARAAVEEDFDVHRQAARLRMHFCGRAPAATSLGARVCA
jgi:colanic acid/amylovoran biosynthesis glycosyltransferase